MIDFSNIRYREKKIRSLLSELGQVEKRRQKKKLEINLFKIQAFQDREVRMFLEQNNKNYQSLAFENFNLLKGDNIEFKVTGESGNPFSSYSIELSGSIHENGYLYYTTSKTNFLYSIIQACTYPKNYRGIINYLGESKASIVERGHLIFGGRVPQSFRGFIDSNGNIGFNTVESYWESGGHYFINTIISDPFKGDNNKRTRFNLNRSELKNMVKIFRENING